jgi:hypothetical protein
MHFTHFSSNEIGREIYLEVDKFSRDGLTRKNVSLSLFAWYTENTRG